MAALNPKLIVVMTMSSAGLQKGASVARNALKGIGMEANKSSGHVSKFKSNLNAMWRITGGILLFNVIRSITRAFRGAIAAAIDFDTQMRNVNSVAQMDEKAYKNLVDQVILLDTDPRIKEGPASLAAGLYTIVSAGYSTADAMVIMEQAALSATAGMTTSAVAADVLASTLGAYGLSAKDAAAMTNTLFQIVNISKYTYEDLASSLDSVTPTAAALGVSMEEIGAAMAVFASHGVDANTATVQMNGILSALLKPSEAMKDVLDQLGYASGSAMLEANGFVGTMKILAAVVGDNEDMAAALFGDVRALRGEMNLVNDGGVALTSNLEKMGHAQDGAGAMSKALAEQMKAVSFQAAVLKKNISILLAGAFGLLAPSLSKALTTVNNVLSGIMERFIKFRMNGVGVMSSLKQAIHNTFAELFGKGSDATKRADKFFEIFLKGFNAIKASAQAMWTVIDPIFSFIKDHFDVIGPAALAATIAIGVLTTAVALFGIVSAISFSPITLIILAVGLLVGLVTAAYIKNWFGFADAVHRLVKWFKGLDFKTGKLGDFVDIFQDLFAGEWRSALKEFTGLFQQLGDVIGSWLTSAGFGDFAKAAAVLFDDLSYLGKKVISLVKNIAKGDWKAAWKDFAGVVWGIVAVVTHAVMTLIFLISGIVDKIPWGRIGGAILDGLWWLLRAILNLAWDIIKGLALALYDAFNEYVLPWLEGVSGTIGGYFEDSYDWLTDSGRNLISGLWDGISAVLDWGFSWFRNIGDWFVGAFNGAGMWLYWIGHDIVNGLWNGMISVINWMRANWDSLWSWMPKFLRGQFQILSPSKVFADIGKQIPAGIVLGIQQGMPGVQQAMEGMTASISGTSQIQLSAHAGAGGVSALRPSSSFSFHEGSIVVQESNDPQATARAILHEIRRVEAGAH